MEEQNKKVLRPRDYFTDSLGQMSINIIGILTGQLTYFYTNKIGMAAGVAGTILMVARIFDALTDIGMGRLVDRTNNSKGKARPWFLRMLIPLPLSIILMFTVPKVMESLQIGYGILTNVFASAICYTAVSIPYYALINYMTKNSGERGKIGVARQVASYIVGYAITITIMPVTNALGGDQKAWILYATIFAVIAFVALLICYLGSKERYSDSKEQAQREKALGTLKSFWYLLRNKYWVLLVFSALFMQFLYAMINSAPVYLCQYVFGDENLYSMYSMIGLGASLAGFLITPWMIQKFGMINSAKIAIVIGVMGCVIRGLFPTNLVISFAFSALVMFGTVPTISVLPVLVCNCTEYNKYKYNVALSGMTTSANSFISKVGSGVAAAMLGFILDIGGFKSELAVQPGSAITSIYWLNIWIPLLMYVLMFVFLAFCKLDKHYDYYVAENAKRQAEEKA